MVRDDGTGYLNFDWDVSSPSTACGIGSDFFFVRWTRTLNFDSGTWRFTATTDDGMRVYVDGSLVIDKWFNQIATTYTADVDLTAGTHTIKVEYYENDQIAVAKLSWGGGAPTKFPDLTLSPADMTLKSYPPTLGDANTIYAVIHNNGNADATDITIQFFNGDPDNGGTQIENDRTIDSISAGDIGLAQISWTTERINDIYVVIDPFDNIPESIKDNNKANIVFILTEFDLSENGFAFKNFPWKIDLPVGDFTIGYYCLGMTIASRYYFLKGINLPTPGDSCNPHGDSIPPWDCPTKQRIVLSQDFLYLAGVAERVASLIEYSTPCRAETEYSILKESLSGNTPEVLILPGHAVLAIGIIEYTVNQKQIVVYDPNYPNSWSEITLKWSDDNNCFVMEEYDGEYDRFAVLRGFKILDKMPTGIVAFSPVNLTVEDPEGLVISKELNEITDTAYIDTEDLNDDGDFDDHIVICDRKFGNYKITVIPESDAEPTDTYTLEVSTEGTTTVLAENAPVSEIPEEPYVFESTNRMCGDVNCDGKVTMSDVRKVFNRYLDPSYPLDLPWAADVNCDGKVS
ncbi:MAG: PA14 domain-containing protein, partial [Patescibacteria group bacterium]|nr:PA14 domain-containing protein [Patescibacteria group bacterium]